MKAKRSLGQNFLVDTHYQQRILNAVQPRAGETLIEIGPGHGALTEGLVASGASVLAVELDQELIPVLQHQFAAHENFRLLAADALKVNFCAAIAPATSARVVANLPYNVSTPIIQHMLLQRNCLRELTVMLQREVVERMTATPGGKEYGVLSVLVQFYCDAVQLFDVPPGAFRPIPKVWSSVVRLSVHETPVVTVKDETLFIELVKVLFSQRRKTIYNNLRAGRTRLGLADEAAIEAVLAAAQLDPRRRGETLTLTEIAALADQVSAQISRSDS
jgi:16S rRNA (adenine1518-N6/adenine1519-N6)-dimethyltransferase